MSSAANILRRLHKACQQAINCHGKMQCRHGFAVLVKIIERSGKGFENFFERSCCCLHRGISSCFRVVRTL